MIDSQKLLSALQKQVRQLEGDLRARCNTNADVDRPLRVEYEAAKEKGRTALTYSAWRDDELTQVAVAWVLGSVFVRFLEDNELIDTPYLAGPDPDTSCWTPLGASSGCGRNTSQEKICACWRRRHLMEFTASI